MIENDDFYQVVRLSLNNDLDSLRLFLARLIKKYGKSDKEFAEKLNEQLAAAKVTRSSAFRKFSAGNLSELDDSTSRLPDGIEKIDTSTSTVPLLENSTLLNLNNIILERKNINALSDKGLSPTKSCIFVGPPGVGKSISALWLAESLNLPLYRIDLALVISSLLGKTGTNLKDIFNFSKKEPCVLFMDEIDAIGKSRNDNSDIGELKRLVTVVMQEIDNWPVSGIIIAATNHPELIDKALWRRFDLIVNFNMPHNRLFNNAIELFSSNDLGIIEKWIPTLRLILKDKSFSELKTAINYYRKGMVINPDTELDLIQSLISQHVDLTNKKSRIDLAVELSNGTNLSHHQISKITGVSRDTLRRHNSKSSGEENHT